MHMKSHSEFKCIIPVQMRFNDIDGQRHVNNAVYQSYYDLGRSGYFTAIKGASYEPGGRSVVIASIRTDFFIPIFFNNSIQVESRVSKVGNKSLTMLQRITDSFSGEIKSTCTTIFAGFDYSTQKSIVIPDEIRQAIEKYER